MTYEAKWEEGRRKRNTELLGMSHGTAHNRLRKLVLFDVLKRHKENICFRCGKEIEQIDELSIEHKVPWERRDNPELFWDLNNVTFSHMACNKPHSYKRY